MKLLSASAFVLLALAADLRMLAAAETPVQTVAFDSASDGVFQDLLSGDIVVGAGHSLGGFTQFDPLLGTLTEIRFTVQVNARVRVTVSASEVIDAGELFSVLLQPGQLDLQQASLIYTGTGIGFGKSVTSDNAHLNPLGGENLDPRDWGAPDTFSYQDTVEEFFGGFANGGDTPSTGSLMADDPEVNLADFVGTGTVPGLRFDLITQFENLGLIQNVPAAFVEVTVGIEAGQATLQYIYTPSTTPVDTVLTAYTRSGDTHRLQFTGRPGRTDWAIKGDPALGLFAADHSAQAVISELSTGRFQAVLTLPSLSEPRYFFRVE